MKALVAILGLLVVGLGTGGGLFYKSATEKEASLTTQLSDAKHELDDTKGKLAAASAAGNKASQHSDALAGLLSRKTDIEKVVNEDLFRATERIKTAEQALMESPSKDSFEKLKNSYVTTVQIIDKATPMLDVLAAYMDKNKNNLVGNDDV